MKEINIYLPRNEHPIKTRDVIELEEKQAEEYKLHCLDQIFRWVVSLVMIGMGIYSVCLLDEMTILIATILMGLTLVSGVGQDEEL